MPMQSDAACNPAEDLIRLQASRDAAVQAARAAVRDTTRLTRLLAILTEPGTTEMVLDKTLSTLSELFAADVIVLLDPVGTGALTPLASIGLPEYMLDAPFDCSTLTCLHQIMDSGKPLQLQAPAECGLLDSRFDELGIEIATCLSVCGENSARGVLIVARCRHAPFAQPEIDLLSTMAYRIGLALEDAQRKVQLEQIIQCGNTIGRHLDKTIIAAETIRQFPGLAGADSGAMVFLRPGGVYECRYQRGLPEDYQDYLPQLAAKLVRKDMLSMGQPCRSDEQDLLRSPDLAETQGSTIQAMLALPIHGKNSLIGILFAFRHKPFPFNAITIQMGMLYANYLSAAFENARLYQARQHELNDRIKAELALRTSDNRFRALIRGVSDIITVLSPDGNIQYISPAGEFLWNMPLSSIQQQNITEYVPDEDHAILTDLLHKAELQEQATTLHGDIRFKQHDGVWRSFEVTLVNLLHDPAVKGIVATFHDVTERNRYESELTKLAYRDPLTGLANRAHFMERLHAGLVHACSSGSCVAVFFLDLDKFKQVNDNLGHAFGDEVLRTVATRVCMCLRKGDIAARLGGDEFTLLIEGISAEEQIVPMAERLLSLLHQPMRIGEEDIQIGGSIGIAVSHPNEDNRDTLLRKADLAMYQAKTTGRGRFVIYQDER